MSLPAGFRFHPTDIDLITYYLKRKVMGKKLNSDAIIDLNIYKFDPWDITDKCLLKNKDLEGYFFCPGAKKNARLNRATKNGYWKATGKDRPVTYNQRTVGSIKTLVFHRGHAPKGERTDWVMHEYRLKDQNLVDVVQDAYVLCKIFQKSGLGPKNGAHYGAPFNKKERSDKEEKYVESPPVQCQMFSNNVPPSDINAAPERDPSTDGVTKIDMQPSIKEVCVKSSAADSCILPNYVPPGTIGSSAAMFMTAPRNSFIWSTSKSSPSTTGPLDMDIPDNPLDSDMDMLTEDINTPPIENITNENFDRNVQLPGLDENDIYNNIGDLVDWIEMRDTGANILTSGCCL